MLEDLAQGKVVDALLPEEISEIFGTAGPTGFPTFGAKKLKPGIPAAVIIPKLAPIL